MFILSLVDIYPVKLSIDDPVFMFEVVEVCNSIFCLVEKLLSQIGHTCGRVPRWSILSCSCRAELPRKVFFFKLLGCFIMPFYLFLGRLNKIRIVEFGFPVPKSPAQSPSESGYFYIVYSVASISCHKSAFKLPRS